MSKPESWPSGPPEPSRRDRERMAEEQAKEAHKRIEAIHAQVPDWCAHIEDAGERLIAAVRERDTSDIDAAINDARTASGKLRCLEAELESIKNELEELQ